MSPKLTTYFVANKLKYSGFIGVLYNLLFSIKGRAILYIYYAAHYNNIVSFFLRRSLKSKYHIEVGTPVYIGSGLVLNHPYNIIIDSNVQIGNNCQIDQNVTIGGNMKKSLYVSGVLQNRPVIGNNVILCSGCLIGGPIRIENNCIIGANTTVTFNVEEGSVVSNVSKVTVKKIVVNKGTYQII